ncbi:hypothetical protein C0995_007963 [Termitomyces sp. Mi166|nr:hypothetical protein C0995_007963 [Termitomyces sp. Mi166\
MSSFRSAAISLLRRPHARPFTSQSAPPPPKKKFNIKDAMAAKAAAQLGKAAKNRMPLRDFRIPHRLVHLVDPETGKLSDLQPLKAILASLNQDSHYVELVNENPAPIVRIYNRYIEKTRAAEIAHRAREVARQNVQKEVQLSWGSAPADLAHKISKVREDLLRGARVDLVFARKIGQPRIAPPVMHERVSEAIASLLDVAKEWKEREVRHDQGLVAVFLEGTQTAEAAAADTPDTNIQPETPGKKFAVFLESTPTDEEHVVRRMRKELAKGTRAELVISAKASKPKKKGAQDEPLEDKPLILGDLHARAEEVMKQLRGEAVEWRERDYRPVSGKLIVFLEKEGGAMKGKIVVHKGPKPKKVKASDIPDLFQD